MEVVESEALGMEVAELENDAAPTSKAAEPKSATGMASPGPSASLPRAADPEQASSAALKDAVAAIASKSRDKKTPRKPEKFFKQVVVPNWNQEILQTLRAIWLSGLLRA